MALSDLIAVDRESLGWIKEETAFATEVKPAAANQFLVAGEGSINQQIGFIEDAQRRNTYSQLRRFAGRFNPGEARLPIYIKPSGTVDVPPEGSEFLKGLLGRESISAGVSVSYLLQRVVDVLPSHTLWLKQGGFVYRCLGLIVNAGRFPLRADNSPEAVSQAAFECMFAELRWTGTDTANETISTIQTDLTVVDAKKFTVGSYIQKRDQSSGAIDNNTDAGFQVTAVNYSTNVLTISPGITNTNIGDYIEPWTPAVAAEVGVPIHGRLGSCTLGGANLPLVSGEIALDNQLKMLNEEKNGLSFANRFARRSVRKVSVKADIYFDGNGSKYFYNAPNQVRGDFVFPWGTTTAAKFTLTAKNVELSSPSIAGGEEKIMTLEGEAFASSSLDDELVGLFN